MSYLSGKGCCIDCLVELLFLEGFKVFLGAYKAYEVVLLVSIRNILWTSRQTLSYAQTKSYVYNRVNQLC